MQSGYKHIFGWNLSPLVLDRPISTAHTSMNITNQGEDLGSRLVHHQLMERETSEIVVKRSKINNASEGTKIASQKGNMRIREAKMDALS